MPDKKEETIPSAAEAQESDEAMRQRAARGERMRAQAVQSHGRPAGPEFPGDQPSELPMDERPGLPPRGLGGLRPGGPEAPVPIENDPEALAAVQDPYNERSGEKDIPMVWTTDADGKLARIPA